MAKNGKSSFAILGMLALLKKSSGYDLKKHMESSTQYFWKETFSSIYPVLEDLEKQKLITKIKTRTKSDRKRNVYSITPEGRNVLKDWLIQSPENIQLRNELLLKLFFGSMVPVEISIEHLENYKKELENKLAIYLKIKIELSEIHSSESVYSLLTLDHGIRQILTSRKWCDNAIKILKSHAKINI